MKFLSKAMNLYVAVGAVVACIIFLFGGISLQRLVSNQNKTYTGTVEATVSDYEVRQEEIESSSGDDAIATTTIQDMYYPIFSYTVDGQEYNTVSDSGSSDPVYDEGTTVTLHYLPEDPTQIFVAGSVVRTVVPFILYAASVIALLIAVITGRSAFKAKAAGKRH